VRLVDRASLTKWGYRQLSGHPTLELEMATTTVIGLGILAWAVLSVPAAFFVAQMIRLRDRQRPDCPEPGALTQGMSADGAESTRTPSKWRLRNRI
jgi:hypothetical protein